MGGRRQPQLSFTLTFHLPLALALLLFSAAPFGSALSSSPLPPPPAPPLLPTSPDDVVRQAAESITRAYVRDGVNLQSVRLPLSESIYGDREEGFVADRAIGWQGGPRETYRYLSPLASDLLRRIRTSDNAGGLPVKVSEQVLLDFDGSALQTSEHPAGALYDVQALLQPNTDGYYLDAIEQVQKQFSNTEGKPKRLFLLINPAWRDRGSWGFFGGRRAQEVILDRFETTYAVDQFVVRGRRVSLLKRWGEDWAAFVESDDENSSPGDLLATFPARPEYKAIDAALTARAR